MITVDGDSMEPVFSSGDHVLINVSRKVPMPPGIFVIWNGMGLVAKRIEHVPHSEPPMVVLKSLNPTTTATNASPRRSASPDKPSGSREGCRRGEWRARRYAPEGERSHSRRPREGNGCIRPGSTSPKVVIQTAERKGIIYNFRAPAHF